MSLIQPTRRGLIGALIAGPAVVRVASIMPVTAAPVITPRGLDIVPAGVLPASDEAVIESFLHNGREYIQLKYKCEDGVVRSTVLSLL